MADLSVTYMGLNLKNPIVVASSSLTGTADKVKQCENSGAGAVILKSIFEEQILAQTDKDTAAADFEAHAEAWNYVTNLTREHHLDAYLDLIEASKKAVKIPVIASVNCVTGGSWVTFAKDIQDRGADALELNVFDLDLNPEDSSKSIEDRYVKIVETVKKRITIPVAMKIGNYFTNIAGITTRLCEAGADGIVLFNRFAKSDIDLKKMKVVSAKPVSTPDEIVMPIRWIGLLSHSLKCDLSGATGVHTGEDAAKMLLAGAKSVQVASALYMKKISYLSEIVKGLNSWMDANGFKTMKDVIGKLSGKNSEIAKAYSRFQYMRYRIESDNPQ